MHSFSELDNIAGLDNISDFNGKVTLDPVQANHSLLPSSLCGGSLKTIGNRIMMFCCSSIKKICLAGLLDPSEIKPTPVSSEAWGNTG